MAETSGIRYHRYRRMGLQHLQDAYTIASTIESRLLQRCY